MVIQVQRESGLANRTYVLSPRQVAMLRFLLSKRGIAIIVALASSWLLFAFLAFRVPVLTQRIDELQHENKQLDSLTVALSQLHGRYDQIRRLLSATATTATAAPAAVPATSSPVTRAATSPADSTTHAPSADSTTTPRKP
jgi:hypothetical protein